MCADAKTRQAMAMHTGPLTALQPPHHAPSPFRCPAAHPTPSFAGQSDVGRAGGKADPHRKPRGHEWLHRRRPPQGRAGRTGRAADRFACFRPSRGAGERVDGCFDRARTRRCAGPGAGHRDAPALPVGPHLPPAHQCRSNALHRSAPVTGRPAGALGCLGAAGCGGDRGGGHLARWPFDPLHLGGQQPHLAGPGPAHHFGGEPAPQPGAARPARHRAAHACPAPPPALGAVAPA